MRYVLATIVILSIVISAMLFLEPTSFSASSGDGGKFQKPEIVQVLARSPFRSDAWLALASIEQGPAAERALGAAYLVGGEKIEDVPTRLRLAVLSGAFQSDTLHEFVKSDLSLIVHRVPSLKPLLLELDAKIDAKMRGAFDSLLRDVDPNLLPPR